jgi:HSP20 family protein
MAIATERCQPNCCDTASLGPVGTFAPMVDIVENENKWVLHAELPGATAETVDVQYERGFLTIRASVPARQNENEAKYLVREYGVGDFHRTFEIGGGIDASRIQAAFKDGVLTLHLPKVEEIRPRKISVKVDLN